MDRRSEASESSESRCTTASRALSNEAWGPVTVYGVTNRPVVGQSLQPLTAPEKLPDNVLYYKQEITLAGDEIQFSETTRPSNEVTLVDKSEFDRQVTAAAQNSCNGRLEIFIPGMRNTPGQAAYDAALISRRLGAPVVVQDWASSDQSNSSFYNIPNQISADYRSALQSRKFVAESVSDLVDKVGGNNVDLIAHSLGSEIQLHALKELNRHGQRVRSATFTHPDVDVADFAKWLRPASGGAAHMNFITDDDDWAVRFSGIGRKLSSLIAGTSDWREGTNLGVVGLNHDVKALTGHAPNYFTWKKERGLGFWSHTPDLNTIVQVVEVTPPPAVAAMAKVLPGLLLPLRARVRELSIAAAE